MKCNKICIIKKYLKLHNQIYHHNTLNICYNDCKDITYQTDQKYVSQTSGYVVIAFTIHIFINEVYQYNV